MDQFVLVVLGLLTLALLAAILFIHKLKAQVKALPDATEELARLQKSHSEWMRKIDDARNSFASEEETRTRQIKSEIASLEAEKQLLLDDHDLLQAGFYQPRYNLTSSVEYKRRLDEIRNIQKQMIKDKKAIICTTEWMVGGSKAEGKKMTDRIIKLGLAAFNTQCDNEIFEVKFDNIDRIEQKINKIRNNVDKLLEPNTCRITDGFMQIKLQELFLAYEYEEKVAKEKAEQKALREQAREEEKARREAEKAQQEAEREEIRYTTALEKARAQLQTENETQRLATEAKIIQLEQKLSEALALKERAKSMAELTRAGHVYIISNIGAFGEDIYKIGMTRRLDPEDRVDELSDASVPFDFDIHALIKTDDAPGLELALHNALWENRLNRVNDRKEFFAAKIQMIEQICRQHAKTEFKLTLLAEAKEWRQTQAMKQKQAAA